MRERERASPFAPFLETKKERSNCSSSSSDGDGGGGSQSNKRSKRLRARFRPEGDKVATDTDTNAGASAVLTTPPEYFGFRSLGGVGEDQRRSDGRQSRNATSRRKRESDFNNFFYFGPNLPLIDPDSKDGSIDRHRIRRIHRLSN